MAKYVKTYLNAKYVFSAYCTTVILILVSILNMFEMPKKVLITNKHAILFRFSHSLVNFC